MDQSEFYRLFNHYWWLIFPIGWGLAGLMRAWMKHRRAERALEILTTYAHQNKEPPPELLALLRPRERKERNPSERQQRFWGGGFFFAALAIAFAVLTFGLGGKPSNFWGLLFVAVLMAGFATGFFLIAWMASHDKSQLPPS